MKTNYLRIFHNIINRSNNHKVQVQYDLVREVRTTDAWMKNEIITSSVLRIVLSGRVVLPLSRKSAITSIKIIVARSFFIYFEIFTRS